MGKVVKSVGKFLGKVAKAGMGLVGLLFRSPKKTKASASTATDTRLNNSLVPEENRKIVFGETALGTDMRYWETYGTNNTRHVQMIAAAGHEIEGFGNTYFEEIPAPFTNGIASGIYAGVVGRTTVTKGVSAQGLAFGTGARWNASASMTGCAYFVLDWIYSPEKLPNGIPQRITQVGKGAKLYDPRRDSTRGGIGAHRADDPATWEYAPLDSNGVPIGRNNALQMLAYQLGIKIKSPATGLWVLVGGRGAHPDDIDFASFITAANDCELERWYSDCVLSTGDSHSTNEGILEAASGGELQDPGGRFAYFVSTNDTANIAATFETGDIIGDVDWNSRKSMSRQFNEVPGTFVDPAALFQQRPLPLCWSQAYYDEDGYKKRSATRDLVAVQDAAQGQKLLRIYLNQSRFQGEFSAVFNLKALAVKSHDVIRLNYEPFLWVNKLFRVVQQGIAHVGGIALTLEEVDGSIWNPGVVVAVPPPLAGYSGNAREEISVGAITSLASGVISGTSAVDTVQLTWPVGSQNVLRTEVRYRKTGEASWTWGAPLRQDQNLTVLGPLMPNTNYTYEVRHVSVWNVPGPWATGTRTTNSVTRNPAGLITYADGTPVEDLKPSGPNANNTGANIAAGFAGQGALATQNAVTEAQMLAAGVSNAAVDTEFSKIPTTWTTSNTTGLVASSGVTKGAFWSSVAGTPASNTRVVLQQVSAIGLAVSEGQRVEASAFVGGTGWFSIQVRVHWVKDDGTAGTQQAPAGGTVTSYNDGANYDVANMTRVGGFVTAPAGARTAYLVFYAIGDGFTANPEVRIKAPLLSPALSGQTVLRAFTPGFRGVPGADPTGANISAGFTGQGPGATATADQVLNANISSAGPNIIRWTRFERGMENVAGNKGPNGLCVQSVQGDVDAKFADLSAASTVGGSDYFGSFIFGYPYANFNQPFQVASGGRYCVAVRGIYASGAATKPSPRVGFFDINKNPLVGTYVVSDATISEGGQTVFYSIIDAPVGASFAFVEVFGIKTLPATGAASYRFDHPMLRQIVKQSVVYPGYVDGPNAVAGADPTGANIAAGIVGQGALASQSTVAWASQVTGVGKPADDATKSFVFRSEAAPVATGVNDTWVQLNGSGVAIAIKAWNGSAWVTGADITNFNTSAAIAGQGPGATASAADVLNNALFGPNANRVTFSEFDRGTTGFVMSSPSVNGGSFFTGDNNGQRYIRYNWNTPATSEQIQISVDPAYTSRVVQGERLSISVFMTGDTNITSWRCEVQWINEGGGVVRTDTVASGTGSPAFARRAAFMIVPTGAVKVRMFFTFVTNATATSDKSVFVGQPMITAANANQTIHAPYQPGPNAVPGSDPTSANIAGGVAGQGPLATVNYTGNTYTNNAAAAAAGRPVGWSYWNSSTNSLAVVVPVIEAETGFVLGGTASPILSGISSPTASAFVSLSGPAPVGTVTYKWIQTGGDPCTMSGTEGATMTANIGKTTGGVAQFRVYVSDNERTKERSVRIIFRSNV